MTTYFYSKKSALETTDIFMPLPEEVTTQNINLKFLKPILSFSPEKFRKLTNVPKLYFILTDGTIPGIEYKVLDNGKFEIIDDLDELYKLMANGFEDGELSEDENFYLEWDASTGYLSLSEERPIRLEISEKPDWPQGEGDWGWEDTLFIASMKCYYSNETFFLFYDPNTKTCLQVSQST